MTSWVIHPCNRPHDVCSLDSIYTHDLYGLRDLPPLRPGAVVLDIGGGLGGFARLVQAVQPTATIISVEPNPRNIDLIEHNAPLAHVIEAAVHYGDPSDPVGLLDTVFPGGVASGGSRVVPIAAMRPDHEYDQYIPRRVPLATTTIEALVDEHVRPIDPAGRVDVLKIDAEGAEHGILCGIPADVARRVDVILGEYHGGFDALRASAGTLADRTRGLCRWVLNHRGGDGSIGHFHISRID